MGNCSNTNERKEGSIIKAHTFVEFHLKKFVSDILEFHNKLRKTYNLPELKLNDYLSALAENYAKKLMSTQNYNSFQPNIYNGVCVGENVVISKSNNAENIFKYWSEEGVDYNFEKKHFSKEKSHFTQIIWKETTDIGIGFFNDQINNNNCTVVLYYPPGNIFGDFEKNVSNKFI